MASALACCRAAAYSGSSRASHSAHGYPYGLLLMIPPCKMRDLGRVRGAGRLCRAAPNAGGCGGPFRGPSRSKVLHDLGRVLVDVLDAPVRDGRRLHGGDQVAPAQRRARRVEFLVGGLVMLQR